MQSSIQAYTDGSTATKQDAEDMITQEAVEYAEFDLTHFDEEAAGWSAVLESMGLEYVGERDCGGCLWSDGETVTISTRADPFTGELYTGGETVYRDVGYASGMMICGEDAERVQAVVDSIIRNAVYIKGGEYVVEPSDSPVREAIRIEQEQFDVELPEEVMSAP